MIFTIAIALASYAAAAPFYGLAQAKDGDSLMVGQTEVRLFGIDAPEYDQSCKRGGADWSCGAEAADRLSRLVTGKDLRCTSVSIDQHGRTLARCTVGAVDVNRTMVATGFAVAYRRYSTDYVSAEQSAKANKRGIWAGSFELPSDYRHEGVPMVRSPVVQRSRGRVSQIARAQPSETSYGCSIKGNRGSNGWIYHLPGMPYYSRTKAEQMFCSEGAAQAAGYRRAKVR
jgi:endonuclease YncB( thermonuclease family)